MEQVPLYLINLFAASIFFVLWRAETEKTYFVRWGMALMMIPPIQELGLFLSTNPDPYHLLATLGFSLAVTILITGLVIGGLSFQKIRLSWLQRYGFFLGLFAGLAVAINLLPFRAGVVVVSALIAGTYGGIAWFLWSKGLVPRLIACIFALKAIMSVIIAGGRTIPALEVALPSLGVVTATGFLLLAISLLIIAFKKINEDLSTNLRFMSLEQAITAGVQAAGEEAELAQTVLGFLVAEHFWDGGLIYGVNRQKGQIELLGWHGKNLHAPETSPLAGSLSEKVLQDRLPLVTSTPDIVPGISSGVRDIHRRLDMQGNTLIVIPMLNPGEGEGVIILFHKIGRDIIAQELETLSSIGNIVGLALANIRDRKKLEERATHDTLTGLGNRASFHDVCQPLIGNTLFSVLLFDLNDFKEINDVFGHSVGDQFLVKIAQRLKSHLPKEATAFRLGGDEFVVVVRHRHEPRRPLPEAEKLSAIIKQPVLIDDFPLKSSAAIGVATSLMADKDSHELLRCADLAMYQAKKNDRHIAYYDKAQDNLATERMHLLVEIEQAIENNELELFYQPIVSLADQRATKCEALVRWHHPKHGLMEAGEFMPWVETTAIIDALTLRVVELVAADMAFLRDQGIALRVAINLSARNLVDHRLPDFIDKTLAKNALPTGGLCLEITETMLMRDLNSAQVIARQLAMRGYNIIIDDFGTGHSSLAYLGRFPISQVKIDKSFVFNMLSDHESYRLIKAIIELIHKLDLKVIAEGVENSFIHEALEAMGCDYAQGYHYARPMKKTDLVGWLKCRAVDPALH